MLGKVRVPLNTNDFSSFLLQAQASKAKVIGLANAGRDFINSVKQALVVVADVAALGLPTAQGLALTETWYWDSNENNRAFRKEPHSVFAVLGAAYIPEHHLDSYGHYVESPRSERAEFGGLWVLCASIIAAWTHSGRGD